MPSWYCVIGKADAGIKAKAQIKKGKKRRETVKL
jgi:hypothetical protein